MYAKRRAFFTESKPRKRSRGVPVRLLNIRMRCGHYLVWPAVAATLPGAADWVELRANRHENICPFIKEEDRPCTTQPS